MIKQLWQNFKNRRGWCGFNFVGLKKRSAQLIATGWVNYSSFNTNTEVHRYVDAVGLGFRMLDLACQRPRNLTAPTVQM
jgi:hypothetical protein